MRVFRWMLVAFVLLISVGVTWADPANTFPCPKTGQALYCNQVIVINGDGTVSIFTSSNSGGYNISATPYDAAPSVPNPGEDQLVGVVDLYAGFTVDSLNLSGTDSNGGGIFNFDGDGANAGGNACVESNFATDNAYGCNGQVNALDAANPYGTVGAGYAGFINLNQGDVYFTNYNPVSFPASTGTVNFAGGLNNGDTAWFSLEGTPSTTTTFTAAVSVTQVAPTGTTTPEPSALWFLTGVGVLGIVSRKVLVRAVKAARID